MMADKYVYLAEFRTDDLRCITFTVEASSEKEALRRARHDKVYTDNHGHAIESTLNVTCVGPVTEWEKLRNYGKERC